MKTPEVPGRLRLAGRPAVPLQVCMCMGACVYACAATIWNPSHHITSHTRRTSHHISHSHHITLASHHISHSQDISNAAACAAQQRSNQHQQYKSNSSSVIGAAVPAASGWGSKPSFVSVCIGCLFLCMHGAALRSGQAPLHSASASGWGSKPSFVSVLCLFLLCFDRPLLIAWS